MSTGPRNEWEVNFKERENMKGRIICLTCIAIAPLALAQTNVSQTGSERSSKGNTTQTTAAAGQVKVVNSFVPGSSIAVGTAPNTQPINYILSKNVQYVDSAGNPVDPGIIRPGTHVRLVSTGDDKRVDRVVFIQPDS